MLCRSAFAHVAGTCNALIEYIAAQGPSAVLDVDDLLLREAMDVIGGTALLNQLSCSALLAIVHFESHCAPEHGFIASCARPEIEPAEISSQKEPVPICTYAWPTAASKLSSLPHLG